MIEPIKTNSAVHDATLIVRINGKICTYVFKLLRARQIQPARACLCFSSPSFIRNCTDNTRNTHAPRHARTAPPTDKTLRHRLDWTTGLGGLGDRFCSSEVSARCTADCLPPPAPMTGDRVLMEAAAGRWVGGGGGQEDPLECHGLSRPPDIKRPSR